MQSGGFFSREVPVAAPAAEGEGFGGGSLRLLQTANNANSTPLWVIIVASVGGGLALIAILAIVVALIKRRKKKKAHAKLEEKMFDYEKQRAHKMLTQVKRMNRDRAQQAYGPGPPSGGAIHPPCQHGYGGHTMMVCSLCYPQPPPMVGMAPAGHLHHHGGGGPQAFVMAPPPHVQQPAPIVRRASSWDDYRRDYDEENDYDYDARDYESGSFDENMPRMRRAESQSEMPSGPPPEAPPGFRVVPMVIEERTRR